MCKVMIFIDGTWLYLSTSKLSQDYGVKEFHIDYGKLPKVLGQKISESLGIPRIDIVRTNLFGSNAVNYDWRDEEYVKARSDFFEMLKEEYHYEVEIFPVDFRKRRIRKADRDPSDDFEPKEKCVDVALATSILYYAAIPNAYDIALAIIGDRDYIPMLQHVRWLGKRTVIASIKKNCAAEFADSLDKARIKDADIIWLNDLIAEIELKFERQQLLCNSPLHVGDKKFWTDYRPRKGEKIYCPDCRKRFAEQKTKAMEEYVSNNGYAESETDSDTAMVTDTAYNEQILNGYIKKVIFDKGYGFISAEDKNDYFFHISDLVDMDWHQDLELIKVQFTVKQKPSAEKSGAAKNVERIE